MAVDDVHVRRLWRAARLHLQVEVLGLPSNPVTPGLISIPARVHRVFRGAEIVRVDDPVVISLPVIREGEQVPAGEPHLIFDNLDGVRFMEALADGEPPALRCVYDGFAIIDDSTREPTLLATELPEPEPRPWWKFWA